MRLGGGDTCLFRVALCPDVLRNARFRYCFANVAESGMDDVVERTRRNFTRIDRHDPCVLDVARLLEVVDAFRFGTRRFQRNRTAGVETERPFRNGTSRCNSRHCAGTGASRLPNVRTLLLPESSPHQTCLPNLRLSQGAGHLGPLSGFPFTTASGHSSVSFGIDPLFKSLRQTRDSCERKLLRSLVKRKGRSPTAGR